MADTDTITPALTPDEWRDALRDVPGTIGRGYVVTAGGEWQYTIRGFTVGGVSIEVPYDGDADISPSHIPALLAIANAALPNDDPRKITRENVRYILAASDLLLGDSRLRDIAANLAALLPPE